MKDVKLGNCCMCADDHPARNILMLDRRALVSGRGWGCVVCGLAPDGAVAVLCDACLHAFQEKPDLLTMACFGYPAGGLRVPIADLPPGDFKHDDAKHRTDEARQ